MGGTISENVRTSRVLNSQSSAATDVNSSVVDTANFGRARFEALIGAINTGGSVTVKVQQGTLANGSDMADLIGVSVALTDTDDNKVAVLEVLNPRERYLRCVIVRSTQPSVIDGVLCLLGGPSLAPTTDDASTIMLRVIASSPADG